MTDLLTEMVAARLPWVSSPVRTWCNDARLAGLLGTDLGPQAALVGDESFGADLRANVGLEIGEPTDWANRRITLLAGGWAVCEAVRGSSGRGR